MSAPSWSVTDFLKTSQGIPKTGHVWRKEKDLLKGLRNYKSLSRSSESFLLMAIRKHGGRQRLPAVFLLRRQNLYPGEYPLFCLLKNRPPKTQNDPPWLRVLWLSRAAGAELRSPRLGEVSQMRKGSELSGVSQICVFLKRKDLWNTSVYLESELECFDEKDWSAEGL